MDGSERRGRGRPVTDKRIQVLVLVNPKRLTSPSYGRFNLYKDGMTVAEYLKAGGKSGDVTWDKQHGFIELY